MRQQALQTGLTLGGQGVAGHKRCSAEGRGKLQALSPCYLATVLFCRCSEEGKSLMTPQLYALLNTRKPWLASYAVSPLRSTMLSWLSPAMQVVHLQVPARCRLHAAVCSSFAGGLCMSNALHVRSEHQSIRC